MIPPRRSGVRPAATASVAHAWRMLVSEAVATAFSSAALFGLRRIGRSR